MIFLHKQCFIQVLRLFDLNVNIIADTALFLYKGQHLMHFNIFYMLLMILIVW